MNQPTDQPPQDNEPKAYIDQTRPGIVRFEGSDEFDGILAGTRSAELVKRWNGYRASIAASAQGVVPPLNIYEKAKSMLDVILKRRRENLPSYASDISDIAHALQAAFEDGVQAELSRSQNSKQLEKV